MNRICVKPAAGQSHQTEVLLRSLIDNSGAKDSIFVIDASFSAEEKKKLTDMSGNGITVRVTDDLKTAAADAERLLVLRADTLILRELQPLFSLDLQGKPMAAVSYGDALCDSVVLYDVAFLRSNGWRTEHAVKEQTCPMPVRWAYRPAAFFASEDHRKIDQINTLYNTAYQSRKDLYQDAAIVVYDGDCSPWKAPDTAMGYLWRHEEEKLLKQLPCTDACPVSVIIPCWNTAAWVRETLDSMLEQALPGIEIICMDDGSTDGTAEILQEYAEKHPEINVYRNENHGAGWVRNEAVRLAKGKYIYFMDSDDLLEPGTLKKLYACAEENRLDAVVFEGTTFYDPPELKTQYASFGNRYTRGNAWPAVQTGRELFTRWCMEKERWIVGCVMMMTRRELLLAQEIRFDGTIMYEDNLFYYHLLNAAERVLCLPDAFYLRRMRASSIMTGKKDPQKKAEAIAAVAACIAELTVTDDAAYREALLLRYRRWMEGSDIVAFREEYPDELKAAFSERVDSLLISKLLTEHQTEITELKKQIRKLTIERDEARELLRRPVRYAVRHYLDKFRK